MQIPTEVDITVFMKIDSKSKSIVQIKVNLKHTSFNSMRIYKIKTSCVRGIA